MGKVTTLFEDSSKTIELYPRTKTSAVSDSDGNTLGDVAVWNALDVASGIDTLKVGIDMDLLWENASPMSQYSGGTVSLDLSDYRLVYIVYKLFYSSITISSVNEIAIKGRNTYTFIGSAGYIWFRQADVSDTGIVFSNGTRYGTYGSGTETSNSERLVPLQIYGIRGQINDLTGD